MTVPGESASTDDVVAWLLGEGHLDCLDEDSRPLGEQASARYLLAEVDERHRRFGDSRDGTGLPCNVAALKQMARAWPVVLHALRSFEPEAPASAHHAWRRAQAATGYARLLALRAPHRALPREVAALYKVTLGFGELLSALLLEEALDADAPAGDEGALMAWLDARPFLVGERQVCAGSRAQIREVWGAIRGRAAPSPSLDWSAPWVLPALDATIELAALAAAAAGAASAYVMAGRLDEVPSLDDAERQPTALRLLRAEAVPRLCETLRTSRNASALHTSLLFPSAAVPASLRAFLEALGASASSRTPFAAADALLEEHARPVAARLVCALERGGGPLTLEAFRRACR